MSWSPQRLRRLVGVQALADVHAHACCQADAHSRAQADLADEVDVARSVVASFHDVRAAVGVRGACSWFAMTCVYRPWASPILPQHLPKWRACSVSQRAMPLHVTTPQYFKLSSRGRGLSCRLPVPQLMRHEAKRTSLEPLLTATTPTST